MWRHLPGPWPVKALLTLALLVIAVALLFLYVFPWAEQVLPFLQVTVEDDSALGPVPVGVGRLVSARERRCGRSARGRRANAPVARTPLRAGVPRRAGGCSGRSH
jgi:hypothetical protein